MARFVLVHGAWHAAWCWERLIPLLQAAGHDTVALNLPGAGDDPTPIAQVTAESYVNRVGEALARETEPAVLVAHSAAGSTASEAAERWPERIDLLVFLSATMLGNGQSGMSAMAEGDPDSLLMRPGSLVVDENTGALIRADGLSDEAFYQDCDAETRAWADARLDTEYPAAPGGTPVTLTQERYGSVRRAYVHTTNDRAITYPFQQRMVNADPCPTRTLDSGHSPFLSCPDALAEALVSLVGA